MQLKALTIWVTQRRDNHSETMWSVHLTLDVTIEVGARKPGQAKAQALQLANDLHDWYFDIDDITNIEVVPKEDS